MWLPASFLFFSLLSLVLAVPIRVHKVNKYIMRVSLCRPSSFCFVQEVIPLQVSKVSYSYFRFEMVFPNNSFDVPYIIGGIAHGRLQISRGNDKCNIVCQQSNGITRALWDGEWESRAYVRVSQTIIL